MSSDSNFLTGTPIKDRSFDLLISEPARLRRYLKRKLQDELRAAGFTPESINVEQGPEQQPLWLAGIRVRGNHIVLIIPPGFDQSREYWYLFDRLPCVVYLAWLTRKNLDFVVDFSDGQKGFRNVLGFSGNQGSVWLVPDPDFFISRAYASVREQAVPSWKDRNREIIWRGSPNGQGLVSNATMRVDDAALIQRVRMCLLLRDQTGIDARLVNFGRTDSLSQDDARALELADIVGQSVDNSEWRQRCFAIDIDGYTNSWSGLFTKLLMGCCVLKVASPSGYRQWYYHRLEPWQHYIPVAADLSDLQQKIDWCQSHDKECEQVAKHGRELALAMDFETEYQEAAAALPDSPEVVIRP